MFTQSRIFTWGNNEKACLGHSYDSPNLPQGEGPQGLRRIALRKKHISWPERMQRVDGLGVVSDLQCGGWSTTLLTAKGALYTVGVIDGLQFNQQQPPYMQKVMMEPVPLRYPPGFPHPYDRYDPVTAVKQFSTGRAHILALSDSGRIWSWQNIEHTSLHVKLLNHDTVENGKSGGRGVVKKVFAGWNKSSALIEGSGIVLWEPLQRGHNETEIEDTALVFQSVAVPNTKYVETNSKTRDRHYDDTSLSDMVGEVQNFVILEEVVLFNTHLGKVFVAQIFWNYREQRVGEPVELQLTDAEHEDTAFATDVQGSFHNFAVFTSSGGVFTSNQDRLMDLLQNQLRDRPLFTHIPALQHKDVIQLAFGNHHFHALHSPGYITSYGNEPQGCGALGLGGFGGGEGRVRGIRYQGRGGDGHLVPHAYTEGRRVWFEVAKRAWIKFLVSGGVDPAEAMERVRMAIGSPDVRCQGEISDWVEQEGRDWDRKYGVEGEDDDGLGAHFAMSVTAAGWHSGALVLVHQERATKLSRACEIPDPSAPETQTQQVVETEASAHGDEPGASSETTSISLLSSLTATGSDWGRWFLGLPPYNTASTAPPTNFGSSNATTNLGDFQRGTHPINYGASPRVGITYKWAGDHFPRLKLSDGTDMPGLVPFDDWRYGRPEWDLDFTL